jgi:hypothetical protein
MQKSVLDLIPIPDWYESLKKTPNTNNTYQVWRREKKNPPEKHQSDMCKCQYQS